MIILIELHNSKYQILGTGLGQGFYRNYKSLKSFLRYSKIKDILEKAKKYKQDTSLYYKVFRYTPNTIEDTVFLTNIN